MRILALAIIFSASAARAQAPGETEAREPARKSLLSAYLVSVGATSIPIAVGALAAGDREEGPRAAAFGMIGCAALVFGPSAGHWYVGQVVTPGLVMRLGAAGGVVAVAVAYPHDEGPLIVGLMGAVALWETGVIWDAVTLPRAVRRYNKRHELQIAPLVSSASQGPVTGFAIGGEF